MKGAVSASRTKWVLPALALMFALLYVYLLADNLVQVAGGSDSSGYLNSARLLRAGRIVEPVGALKVFGLENSQASLFMPLGFVDAPRPGTMSPSYPTGVPLQMALLSLLGGWKLAPFLVAPLSALGSLLVMYLLGRELGLSPALAFAGSVLLGGFAVFLHSAIQPMSDVPATFWCLAAVWAAFVSRRRPQWAWAAGACWGMAVLVRPTNLLLAVPLVLALPLKPRVLLRFALGGLPFAVFFLSYNSTAYGSAFRTGYGSVGLALANFPPRLHHYSHWLPILLTPLVPLGWVLSAGDRRISGRDRGLLLLWFSVFFLFYCFYGPYETWWYARFLLPGVPAMILAALLVARDLPAIGLGRPAAPGFRRLRGALAIGLLLEAIVIDRHHVRKLRIFRMDRGEEVYIEATRGASEKLPARSLIVAMQVTGALRYYTPLPFVRWDRIEAKGFPSLRQHVEAKGYRWYALIAQFEHEEFAKRLPGRWVEIARYRDVALLQLE